FIVIDAQLRLHISGSIAALNALLAASQANDSSGMDRAYLLGLPGREGIDTVVPGVVASKQVTAAQYTNSVRAWSVSLTRCADCQVLTAQKQIDCLQNLDSCQNMLDVSDLQVASLQSAVVALAAPDSLSAKDTRLQQDLATADSALIAMRASLSTADQAGFDAGQVTLRAALAAVRPETTPILVLLPPRR